MRKAMVNNSSVSCLLPVASCLIALFISSCESELIRKREEQIRHQQEEILRQRKEIEKLNLARQKEEQKRRDCNRAFRSFEKAQAAKDADGAIALYRQGLKLCPDDDVAHYELGIILRDIGRTQEAQEEFEAALKINPNFLNAKRQLETLK
ncbi:MAG: tetratricopeptide repeat protein [Candidatus Binatia bacterium]